MSWHPFPRHETRDQVGRQSALQACCRRTSSQHKRKRCIWYA